MYRKVKKKIAASITNLDSPATKKKVIEIKTPENWDEPVDVIESSGLLSMDFYQIRKPKYALVKTKFPEVKFEKNLGRYFFNKSKTNIVFFDFPRTKSKNIQLPATELKYLFKAIVVNKNSQSIVISKGKGLKEKSEKLSTSVSPIKFNIKSGEVIDVPIDEDSRPDIKLIDAKLPQDIPIEINFKPHPANERIIFQREINSNKGNNSKNQFIETDFIITGQHVSSENYLFTVPSTTDYLTELVPDTFDVSLIDAETSLGQFSSRTKTDITDFSEMYGLTAFESVSTFDCLKGISKPDTENFVSENKIGSEEKNNSSENLLDESFFELPANSSISKTVFPEDFETTLITDIISESGEEINKLPSKTEIIDVHEHKHLSIPKIVFELAGMKAPEFSKPKLFLVSFKSLNPIRSNVLKLNNLSIHRKIEDSQYFQSITINKNSVGSFNNFQISNSNSKYKNELNKYLKLLDSPSVEISAEEKTTIFNGLYDYQVEGVDFLLNNKRAVLADELGLGKTVQASVALKMLLRKGVLKKVLIVTSFSEAGDEEKFSIAGNPIGWNGHIKKWADGLSTSFISGVKSKRKKAWEKDAQINIIDSESLIADFENQTLTQDILNSYSCIILDEYSTEANSIFDLSKIFNKCSSDFIWVLNSAGQESDADELQSLMYSEKDENNKFTFLKRKRQGTAANIPAVICSEKWISFDSEQEAIYNSEFEENRNQLENFLSTGNILRFQANVLFTLHKLNQVANFKDESSSSRKSELLLTHIRHIINAEKKVIVFSNYDKQGIKQIKKIFKEEKIQHLEFLSGMSADELKSAAKKFKSDVNTNVLLASFKSAGARKALPAADFLIHFDPQWNPVSQWQIEDSIATKLNSNSALTVYNYRSNTIVEKGILNLLDEKGILNKQICSNIPAQKFNNILDDDEWMNILGLNRNSSAAIDPKNSHDEKINDCIETFKTINSEDLTDKLTELIKLLGHKIEQDSIEILKDRIFFKSNFSLNGKSVSAGIICLLSKNNNVQQLDKMITGLMREEKLGAAFILFKEKLPEEILPIKNDNVIILDRELLAKLLVQFRLS